MAKRRLTKHQSKRITQNQQQYSERALNPSKNIDNDSQLGPEQTGLVIAHYGTRVEVENLDPENAGQIVSCHLRANLGSIVAGDRVVWRANEQQGVIVSCLERRNELSRPDSFGKTKTIAANVEQMFIIIAPQPPAHMNLIDRYLVIAETTDIQPTIILNKTDLLDEANKEELDQLLTLYSTLRYDTLQVSVKTGAGLAALKAQASDKTNIFVGQSGVGKSSIIQALLPHETIKIGKLSHAMSKGKHTTTNAQLYHFPEGGDCIDSPGIRELGLWHLQADEVAAGFREFQDYLNQCQFRNCRHCSEPGCALRAAVQEGHITAARMESYQQIIASLDDIVMRDH